MEKGRIGSLEASVVGLGCNNFGRRLDLDATSAVVELVKAGKVREVGCSNFSADQLREAEEATRDGAARFARSS